MAKLKKAAPAPSKEKAAVPASAEKAPIQEKAPESKKVTYTVAQRFSGKDKRQYEIGDDVSHFEAGRLASLLSRGLVKMEGK